MVSKLVYRGHEFFIILEFGVLSGTTPGSESAGSPPNEVEEDPCLLRARLDAECQQLARDLQAAVRELVRPEMTLGGTHHGSSQIKNRNWAGEPGVATDENHDYSEIYTPSSDEKMSLTQPPPPPPIHR